MSRGLGALQREILDSLDAARTAQEPHDRGWVLYHTVDMRIIEGVYDLRVVSAYVRRQRHYTLRTAHNFAPMFSRAIHGLVARGALHPVWHVPLIDVRFRHADTWAPFLSCTMERWYFHWPSRQLRFVKRQEKYLTT
jgi:hypothetical protein